MVRSVDSLDVPEVKCLEDLLALDREDYYYYLDLLVAYEVDEVLNGLTRQAEKVLDNWKYFAEQTGDCADCVAVLESSYTKSYNLFYVYPGDKEVVPKIEEFEGIPEPVEEITLKGNDRLMILLEYLKCLYEVAALGYNPFQVPSFHNENEAARQSRYINFVPLIDDFRRRLNGCSTVLEVMNLEYSPSDTRMDHQLLMVFVDRYGVVLPDDEIIPIAKGIRKRVETDDDYVEKVLDFYVGDNYLDRYPPILKDIARLRLDRVREIRAAA